MGEEFNLDNKKLTLAVMGGSQGAKSINNTVVELLNESGFYYIFEHLHP